MNVIDRFMPVLPALAPRKKFRGSKRYYARLAREAAEFSVDFSPGHWYDLWHWHADIDGYGNRSRKDRVRHLNALARGFCNIASQAKDHPDRQFQAFIVVSSGGGGQDGLFFHTPSPNGEFPIQSYLWTGDDPGMKGLFDPMFPGIRMRYFLETDAIQVTGGDGDITVRAASRSIVMYSPDVGVPVEWPYCQAHI